MKATLEKKILKDVDFKRLFGGKSVYVGVPEGSERSDTELTNAQIAYLNSEGVHPYQVSNKLKESMNKVGQTYTQAFQAYIRENGEPRFRIVPRPFLEPGIKSDEAKIQQQLKEIALATVEKKGNSDSLMTELGIRAVNAIQKFIRDYPANELPPNADSTQKRKGFDHPLIGETGEFIKSITFVKG